MAGAGPQQLGQDPLVDGQADHGGLGDPPRPDRRALAGHRADRTGRARHDGLDRRPRPARPGRPRPPGRAGRPPSPRRHDQASWPLASTSSPSSPGARSAKAPHPRAPAAGRPRPPLGDTRTVTPRHRAGGSRRRPAASWTLPNRSTQVTSARSRAGRPSSHDRGSVDRVRQPRPASSGRSEPPGRPGRPRHRAAAAGANTSRPSKVAGPGRPAPAVASDGGGPPPARRRPAASAAGTSSPLSGPTSHAARSVGAPPAPPPAASAPHTGVDHRQHDARPEVGQRPGQSAAAPAADVEWRGHRGSGRPPRRPGASRREHGMDHADELVVPARSRTGRRRCRRPGRAPRHPVPVNPPW